MDYFEIISDDKIYEICENMNLESLIKFVRTSRRHYEICTNLIVKRVEYERIHKPGENEFINELGIYPDYTTSDTFKDNFTTVFTIRCIFNEFVMKNRLQEPYDMLRISPSIGYYNKMNSRYSSNFTSIDPSRVTKMDVYRLIDFNQRKIYDDDVYDEVYAGVMELDKYYCNKYPYECNNPPIYDVVTLDNLHVRKQRSLFD